MKTTILPFAPNRVLRLYLALYAVFRFVLEFFRGDDVRGILGGLSVSQWISIVILLCLFTGSFTAAVPSGTGTSPRRRAGIERRDRR